MLVPQILQLEKCL